MKGKKKIEPIYINSTQPSPKPPTKLSTKEVIPRLPIGLYPTTRQGNTLWEWGKLTNTSIFTIAWLHNEMMTKFKILGIFD